MIKRKEKTNMVLSKEEVQEELSKMDLRRRTSYDQKLR